MSATDFDSFNISGVTTLGFISGTPGDDHLRGTENDDTFQLDGGGEDTAKGGDGADTFRMGAALDAGDRINGGQSTEDPDEVVLDGDYSSGLVLKAKTLVGIEQLTLTAGNDYDLTLKGDPASPGWTFQLDASGLGADDGLTLNASKMTATVSISCGAGADHVITGQLDTNVITGGGADTVLGGSGIDFIQADGESAVLSGGDGDDSIVLSALGAQTVLDGGAGTDNLTLTGGTAEAPAVLAAGKVSGFENFQVMAGYVVLENGTTEGIAEVRVFAVENGVTFDASAVSGTSFNMSGSDANDVLRGGAEGDLILGGHGDNSLIGGGGDDTLRGSDGHDKIAGGLGADDLWGGPGADQFVYLSAADSTDAASDLIRDLTDTDQIVLKSVDANDKKAGDQAFHLVGVFSGERGELVVSYDHDSNLTLIEGDVNGDGVADMVITAAGDHSGFDNFVL